MNYSEKYLIERKAHHNGQTMARSTMRRFYRQRKIQPRHLLAPLGQKLIVLRQWLEGQTEMPATVKAVQVE